MEYRVTGYPESAKIYWKKPQNLSLFHVCVSGGTAGGKNPRAANSLCKISIISSITWNVRISKCRTTQFSEASLEWTVYYFTGILGLKMHRILVKGGWFFINATRQYLIFFTSVHGLVHLPDVIRWWYRIPPILRPEHWLSQTHSLLLSLLFWAAPPLCRPPVAADPNSEGPAGGFQLPQ